MTSKAEKEFAAAREFYTLILDKLNNEKGVHAETAIASAGRMAGTFLLKSFELPIENLEPGDVILSDAANEKGPFLVSLMGDVLQQMNVVIDPQSVESMQGQGEKPHLTIIETQALLETALNRIKEKYRLSYEEAAHAGAITAAILVRECTGLVDPQIGFNIAAYSFVEGAKTIPHRLESSMDEKGKQPWYKFW